MEVDLIITSDWHLRETPPVSRVDDFEKTMWQKVDFISELQKKYDCPVIHAGDLFDRWKPSPYLLAKTIQHLPNDFHTIYGNHDLPQHNLELKDKCGIFVLEMARKLKIINGRHWNMDFNDNQYFEYKNRKIHVAHVMTYQGAKPYPNCTDFPASKILRKYKGFDLIITGHNHQQIVEEYNGSVLLNPGAILRLNSNEQEFTPCVWLWNAEENKLKKVPIPVDKSAVQVPKNRVQREERNERIDAFISKLNNDWGNEMDFEINVRNAIAVNDVSKEVQSIIYQSIGG